MSPAAQVVVVQLGDDAVGQRLDRALVEGLQRQGHAVTRSALAASFERGAVTVGGRPLKPGRVVDRPIEVAVGLEAPAPLRAEPDDLPLHVVFEDEHLLVVDKPAPMVVHPGPGHPRGTLVGAVLHHLGLRAEALPTLPGNDATRPGVVHRLDKGTSGLLVFSKTAAAQTGLAERFRVHDIERRYLGLVHGVPSFATQRVETLHGRDPTDRRRFSPHVARGRRAITTLRVLERLPLSPSGAALMEFELETGRTHQIRMHARALGHPILGDALYGRPLRDHPEPLRTALQTMDRHALHAAVLGFRHPVVGGPLRFESPLPPELAGLLDLARAG